MAKIIIKRKLSMVGCAQNHKVYLSDTFVGELKSGGILEIPVNVGTHTLSFNNTMKILGILLHSDQGSQYSSAGYCNLLKSYNIIQSMSRAGTPRDNAVMESFFGRFKDVMSSHFQYWKCDDIHKVVADTIYYFNYIHPVRKLKRKPPVQYRLELAV